MNCDQHLDLLGLDDDELTPEEQRRLATHLAVCATCTTDRQEALLGRDALERLDVPPLSAHEVERMVAAAMPIPLQAGRKRAPCWVSWVSHAAAILLGLLLARSWSSGSSSGVPQSSEPELREVRVEVPVEVPIEVVVEVPVEVPVEVEKIIYRDRPVPHPLQARWDAQLALAATMGDAGVLALQGFDRALRRMAGHAAEPVPSASPEPAIVAAAERPRRSRAQAAAAVSSQAHVEVRRRAGRVTLVTRGALSDVAPVLIDTLETGEGDVKTAAFDRLQSIRSDFGEEGLALSTPSKARARPGGIRGLVNRGDRRAPGLAPENPALWRDWWSRQKAASGVISLTTSI